MKIMACANKCSLFGVTFSHPDVVSFNVQEGMTQSSQIVKRGKLSLQNR